MAEPGSDDVFVSVVTCPRCGYQREETMPDISCSIFYRCAGCGEFLLSLAGDCCIFCSYGSVPCPAIQRLRRGAAVT